MCAVRTATAHQATAAHSESTRVPMVLSEYHATKTSSAYLGIVVLFLTFVSAFPMMIAPQGNIAEYSGLLFPRL